MIIEMMIKKILKNFKEFALREYLKQNMMTCHVY